MPKEIECVSMRPWDNFFWWLEVEGLPEKSMVRRRQLAAGPRGAGRFNSAASGWKRTRLAVKVQAEKATVWLSPELVDFNERLVVEVNNRAISPRDRIVRPDLERAAGRRPHAGRSAASVLGEAGDAVSESRVKG